MAKIWQYVENVSCMASAYYYSFLVAFNHDHKEAAWPNITFEVIFVLSIVMNFVRSYTPKGENVEIKDFGKIA